MSIILPLTVVPEKPCRCILLFFEFLRNMLFLLTGQT